MILFVVKRFLLSLPFCNLFCEACYNFDALKSAMQGPAKSYQASGNFLWLNLLGTLSGDIPVNRAAISSLKEHFFAKPVHCFPDKITVGTLHPSSQHKQHCC